MTQPDQFFPATAVNATPGFAAYANTTQTDYENQLNNSVGLSPFSGLCGLFSQLPFLDGTSVFGQTHGGDPLGGITTNLMHGIQSLANIFCHILTGASGNASPATLIDGFAGLLEAVLNNPLTNGFIEIATDAGNVIANLLGGIGDFANQLCSVFNTGTPANSTDPANTTTPGGILGALTTITNIFLNNPFMSTLSDLVTGTGSVFFDIINGFVSFFNGILGIFGHFIGATGILSGFQGIIDSFFGIFGGTGTGNTVQGLTGIAGGFFTGLANLAAGIITTIIDTIAGFFGFHPSDKGSGSQGGLGGLGSIIGSLVGSVTGVVSGLFGNHDGTANAAGGFNNNGDGTALFDIITAPVNALINIGEGIAMTVASFIGNLTGSLGGIGSSNAGHGSNSGTLGGLISGIIGAPAALVGGVTHTISDLIHHFLNFPGDNIASNINPAYTGAYDINQAVLQAIWGPDGPPPSDWVEQSRIQTEARYQQALQAERARQTALALALIQAQQAAAAAHETSNNGYGGLFWNFGVTGNDGDTLPATDFASTGPVAGDLVVRQAAKGQKIGTDHLIDATSAAAVGIKKENPEGTYYTIFNHAFAGDAQNLAVALTGDALAGFSPGGALYLLMHCDTALSTGAYCKVATTGLQVGKFVRNGSQFTYTPFADPNSTLALNIGLADQIEFRNVATNWTVSVNAVPLLDADDSTVTFSTARRSAGLAMSRVQLTDDPVLGTGLFDAFQVKAVSQADVVTPTYPGSGCVISNRSGNPLVLSGGGTLGGYFDTIDNISSDLDADLSTATFTVSQAGWYKVDVSTGTQLFGASDFYQPAIYKNGVLHRVGAVVRNTTGYATTTWTVPMHSNDTIQFRYDATLTGTSTLVGGDVNGAFIWASITQTSNTLQA